MPGIAGFISTRKGPSQQAALEQMLKTMLHEPTYTSGTLVEEKRGLWAGWVCHSGSFSDCLPIWNEQRDIGLLFSGENFADQAEVDPLAARGHSFERDNASYLVHGYEELGAGFFPRLNGLFSGLLMDRRENKVVLFNDRYGMGRIYYHETADGFYFASEAKAILQVLPHLRRLDLPSFGESIACGCVLQNRTLFSGVRLLPGASAWTFSPGCAARKEKYFDKQSWENQPPLSQADYYEKLKSTFARILPRYFRNTERVAMSLTGGLDSRIIMAWIGCGPSQVQCYSHRGMFRECADARIARRVAEVCQLPHRVVTVDGEFFSEFPTLAARAVYYTDGTMDVSGAAGLFVNRIARREIAPVRMTGNYGGQILRRLVSFEASDFGESLFNAEFIPHLRGAASVYAAERRDDRLSFIAFKQMPWLHYARYALEQSQLPIRSPYLDNDLVALAFQAPTDLATNRKLAARLIADGNPALAAFPTDRGPLGRPGVLGKIRERCQEFMFKAEYAYDYGMPQWLTQIDRALTPLHVERLFLGRHKYCHYRLWYRRQLAPFVREVLLDSQALGRTYLNRQRVEKIVRAHVTGRGNYTTELHALLTSELMQRQLIAQN